MPAEKQLKIYESVAAVSKKRHANLCVDTENNFAFAKHINAIPIVVGEFSKIAREYPIIFVDSGGTVLPMAMVGLRDNENLFVTPEGAWDGEYVPAFLRRYPYVFAKNDDGNFVLCIDEKFAGANTDGKGRALFKEDGEASDYLERNLAFTTTFQREAQATEKFSSRLADLDILQPAEVNFQLGDGKNAKTSGLLGVDREKLSELAPKQLVELQKSGDLELIYMHLFSAGMVEKFASRLG